MRRLRVISAATTATLALGLLAGVVAAPAQAARSGSGTPDRSALAVLHEAQALFVATPSTFSARTMSVPSRDVTPVLVALRHAQPRLQGADRAAADAILARPTDGARDPYGFGWSRSELRHTKVVCGAHVCVHWVVRHGLADHDSPSARDLLTRNLHRGHDRVPDQVDRTLFEMQHVWTTEVNRFGYAAPKPDHRGDGTRGANIPKVDIYLSDVGAHGYYGFCAPEQNLRKSSGFCVLDNDYSPGQFPTGNTSAQDLQVTAAHEFFHDIQFNYDSFEDTWFMESTAAWMEDEVYPAVNDNLQYLQDSPLHKRAQPLDKVDRSYLSSYGSWIFFRYLSEHFGRGIVRTAWTDAVGAPNYSTKAVDAALHSLGSDPDDSLAGQFSDFAAANTDPVANYNEGSLYTRDAAPLPNPVAIPSAPASAPVVSTAPVKHLAAAVWSVAPKAGSTGPNLKITVTVTSPGGVPPAQQVRLVIHYTAADGRPPATQPLTLTGGTGSVSVSDFNPAKVKRIDVVVANGSRATTCAKGTTWPCRGIPTNDASTFTITADRTA